MDPEVNLASGSSWPHSHPDSAAGSAPRLRRGDLGGSPQRRAAWRPASPAARGGQDTCPPCRCRRPGCAPAPAGPGRLESGVGGQSDMTQGLDGRAQVQVRHVVVVVQDALQLLQVQDQADWVHCRNCRVPGSGVAASQTAVLGMRTAPLAVGESPQAASRPPRTVGPACVTQACPVRVMTRAVLPGVRRRQLAQARQHKQRQVHGLRAPEGC